jgi:prepilin-type N-terminal cleavage/methylation domain-containing protein
MNRRAGSNRGFTLVELLIGSTLASMVMAAVLASFVFLGRNLARLANYQSVEAKSREALAYLGRDLTQAEAVKEASTPTATALTLVLPSGEVTYTYDNTTLSLRRQANFGANQDFVLLQSDYCACTAFSFAYYTATGGSPISQMAGGTNTPYSIKQIQVLFTTQTPGSSTAIRATYDAVSARYVMRNKQLPNGT